MVNTSKVDEKRFREMWDAGASTSAIAQEFGISEGYVSPYARRRGWPQRKVIKLNLQKPQPAPPPPKVMSDILQTGGKYALLCAYADANGISYTRALQLYHIERAATR